MLYKDPDGSVHYRLGDLPFDAVEITVAQFQDIPAPPETSDKPGGNSEMIYKSYKLMQAEKANLRKPTPIEQSLKLMQDEKLAQRRGEK